MGKQPDQSLADIHVFFEHFIRAFLLTATTFTQHSVWSNTQSRPRAIEYITHRSRQTEKRLALIQTHFMPYQSVVLVSGVYSDKNDAYDPLFQLPRTDSFLRNFAKMAHQSRDLLKQRIAWMERVGDQQF